MSSQNCAVHGATDLFQATSSLNGCWKILRRWSPPQYDALCSALGLISCSSKSRKVPQSYSSADFESFEMEATGKILNVSYITGLRGIRLEKPISKLRDEKHASDSESASSFETIVDIRLLMSRAQEFNRRKKLGVWHIYPALLQPELREKKFKKIRCTVDGNRPLEVSVAVETASNNFAWLSVQYLAIKLTHEKIQNCRIWLRFLNLKFRVLGLIQTNRIGLLLSRVSCWNYSAGFIEQLSLKVVISLRNCAVISATIGISPFVHGSWILGVFELHKEWMENHFRWTQERSTTLISTP